MVWKDMVDFEKTWLPALLFLISEQVDAAPAPSGNGSLPIAAAETFAPGWVAGPHTRGTLALVFSCVITLFLCVWTTVHVNIEPENEVNKTLNRVMRKFFRYSGEGLVGGGVEKFLADKRVRKVGWGCVTLAVPEGIMAIAAYERKTAHLLREEVNAIIRKANNRNQDTQRAEKKTGRAIEEWDNSLAYYAVMGGFVIPEDVYNSVLKRPSGEENGSTDLPNKPLTLTPHGILQVAKWEWEGTDTRKLLSVITAKEVHDKSNANTLTKIIVVWQALWMIVQVIGRTASRYPVTLLELHTVLHTFCAVAMYATWWDKPFDIETSTTIPFSLDDREKVSCLVEGTNAPDPTSPLDPSAGRETPDNEEAIQPFMATVPATTEDAISPDQNSAIDQHLDPYLTSRSGLGKLMYLSVFDLHGRKKKSTYLYAIDEAYERLFKARRNLRVEALIISFVGLVYGGVHLAVWKSTFPSYAEKLLWKISAAITATTWLTFTLSLYVYPTLGQWRKDGTVKTIIQYIFRACFGVGLVPVVLVRLYLLVESFASIRKIPKGAYDIPTWSNAWPHAG